MGPLKILGLLASFLTFLYGMGPADDEMIIFIGMATFILCLLAPNEI